ARGALDDRRLIINQANGLAAEVGVAAAIGGLPGAGNIHRAREDGVEIRDGAQDCDDYVRPAAIIRSRRRIEGPIGATLDDLVIGAAAGDHIEFDIVYGGVILEREIQ